MQELHAIRRKVADGQFEYSQHAVDQSIRRQITVKELQEAIATGEIIEDYPNDKYGPSCLIFGTSNTGRPIHIQCSYPSRDRIKVVTVYEPDPSEWIGFRHRRK